MSLKVVLPVIFAFLLTGCVAPLPVAQIEGRLIRNPSFSLAYEVPEGMELYHSESDPPRGELQQMVLRISDLNRQYHPCGNETFYESFLFFSDQTVFLLMMVEQSNRLGSDRAWATDETSRELMPLYNAGAPRSIQLDRRVASALLTAGTAYEKKGWYYSHPKSGRMAFNYEACKVEGFGRDRYVLMGFSLPENQQVLSQKMQDVMLGFR